MTQDPTGKVQDLASLKNVFGMLQDAKFAKSVKFTDNSEVVLPKGAAKLWCTYDANLKLRNKQTLVKCQ